MSATNFQLQAKQILDALYDDVRLEWSVTKDASDLFQRDAKRYAPRVDIAIGPFNTTQGPDSDISSNLVDLRLGEKLISLETNNNPRCLIAIEVTFSGSSKHILGDILNASVLGLYGIVICRPDLRRKVDRNLAYLEDLATLGKLPTRLFSNVMIMDSDEFLQLYRQDTNGR